MSVLKSLKRSDAKPTAQAKTLVERGREKLVENLALQKQLAEATIAGTVFNPPKHYVMRTNGEGLVSGWRCHGAFANAGSKTEAARPTS